MYRRVVSLLMLPCVLLTQSMATLGHAHAGQRLPGHDLRPHFHTQPVPAAGFDRDLAVDPGHHHGFVGLHHHEEALTPQTPTTPDPGPQSDHDTNAVYVTGVDVVANGRCLADNRVDASPLWAIAAEFNFAALWPNSSRHPVKGRHPPPFGSSRPLYVLHLTLLI